MKALVYVLANNTAEQLLAAFGLALLLVLALCYGRNSLVRKLRDVSARTAVIWDDVLTECLASTKLPFIASLGITAGATQMELPVSIEHLPFRAMTLLLILQCGIWGNHAMRAWMQRQVDAAGTPGGSTLASYGVITFIARLAIWLVVLLSLLDNLGVNITTLVASLGIGGIAVALALQNVLGDLFASLSIALDKPFVVGDFIAVDEHMGTVRHVGLKTTRLLSLSGEELVFSNNDLLKSRIRNYKRMTDRRVVFSVGVTYDTPPDALNALTAKIREIIESVPGTRFDRAHFKSFGASSLDIEAVYYLESPDYNAYMDTQQRINFDLLQYCNDMRVNFAFPTRTVHLSSPPSLR